MGGSLQTANNPQSGFVGGVLFGGLIGIIWTPCAGPIFAAIIVQVVIQTTTLNSILVVIAFAIGTSIPMLLIALFGRQVISRFHFLREHTSLLRRVLGFIIILSVIYLALFPTLNLSFSPTENTSTAQPTALINPVSYPYQAPVIDGISAWINSTPLTWSDLKGKVVLIDFWTYSCINCIRTLPYLKEWYAKYHDKGLEIIGIHSPEFQFEHDLNNVTSAVKKFGILYPVALDNQFVTWRNFQNQYWPAHYLINKNGMVVYEYFGEGEYAATENNIRFLLGVGEGSTVSNPNQPFFSKETPETYLGYSRMDNFSSPESISQNASAAYTYPNTLSMNHWALNGTWIISADKITSVSQGAGIKLHFSGKKVYAVMGAAQKPLLIKLSLNGRPLIADHGADVTNSQVRVTQNQLYALIDLSKEDEGELEMITEPGLEIYTFTFGV
jgi:thiol-disulfide isomerase/thioredoxin